MSKVIAKIALKALKGSRFEKLNLEDKPIYFTYQTDKKEVITTLISSIEQTENNDIQININDSFQHKSIILTEDLCDINMDRINKILEILDKKELINKVNSYQAVSLEEWISTHPVSSSMIYKQAALLMFDFFRKLKFKHRDWTCFVVSEHTSKSITLPVLRFQRDNTNIYIRDNFYDYKLSVESDVKINIPLQLVNNKDDIATCYCEGFSPEWVHEVYSESNSSIFTIEIQNIECYLETIFTLVSQQTWRQ